MARPGVPADLLAALRAICLGLPAAYEEAAWTGMRWMIGRRNFAHALMIADDWPPAYARAAATPGPLAVVTFRVPRRRDIAPFTVPPFFKPVWWPDIAGVGLDAGTDWERVADCLIDSYRALAPKGMAAL